jgi:hypothetical protein
MTDRRCPPFHVYTGVAPSVNMPSEDRRVMRMTPRTPSWTTHTRGVSTLIAVLVRYPEVSSLNFDPESGILTVSFCLNTVLDDARRDALHDMVDEVLSAYREMIGAPAPLTAAWQVDSMETLTVLSLIRDVETLSIEEVGLTIELLREFAGSELVADPNDLAEDELMVQEETIQATLESLKESPGGSLLALREEGHILVFNT